MEPIDPVPAPRGDHLRIAAPFVARADRDYRDASVLERHRMKYVTRRCVTQQAAKRAPVFKQVEARLMCEIEQKFAERDALAIRMLQQPDECSWVVFLAPRDERRRGSVEFKQQ